MLEVMLKLFIEKVIYALHPIDESVKSPKTLGVGCITISTGYIIAL